MTDIEKEFVPIELALELKEIGFDEFCLFYYQHDKPAPRFGIESRDIKNKSHFRIITINAHKILQSKNSKVVTAAPSYEQTFAWFRKKGLFHSITFEKEFFEGTILFCCEIRDSNSDIVTMYTTNTYEKGKVELLKKLIEIYKNEKTNI